MKKFLLLLLLVGGIQQVAAQKMREVFAEMPDTVLQLLTKNNRLDCIDFIENDREARVKNIMDGYSVLQQLTENYLSLELTSSMHVEMKLLSAEDSVKYIALLRTYAAPAKNTALSFYTMDWKKINMNDLIQLPCFDAFWKQKTTQVSDTQKEQCCVDSLAYYKKKIDIPFVTASFSSDTDDLVFRLDLTELEKADSVAVQRYVHPLLYQWNRKRYILIEQ